jgi:putative MFS transporter
MVLRKEKMNFSTSTPSTNTVDGVIEKLPISKVHIFVVLAAALGFMFDSFDTYLVSYSMPSIIQEWNISSVTNGILQSAALWGMFIGAIFWGPITDKYGRKFGFMATILGFSILTGMTAFATDLYQFGILRFLTGLCLGGMIPIDTALTSEYISTKYRGRFTSMLTVLWPVGMLIAAGLSLIFMETLGWRILFIIGAVPALLSFFTRRNVPESPRWLASKGKVEETKTVLRKLGASDKDLENLDLQNNREKESANIKTLLSAKYIKRFVLTAGYYFFSYFGYYGFVLWLPTILSKVYHLDLATTFTYTLFVALAAIAGRAVAFYTIEKFGRKQLFYVGFGLGGFAALMFGLIENPAFLVIGAVLLSFLYEQGVAGTVVYTAELYPSNIRATAVCWSTSLGRISAALSPIVFGFFMQAGMYYAIFITMAVTFWIAVLLVMFLGPETKGKRLEEIGAS